jgi:hypothetical protein
MLEFLEQMPVYEWQIGIGFLLLLTGAAAGSWGLATLRAAILSLRPELYRIVRNLRYSFWAVLLGTALILIAIIQNPIVTL